MLKHILLIVIRNFKRNKSSFLINLIGLSTGLACAFLNYLWVNDELHVDKFHKQDKQLYQVMQNYPLANGILTIEATPGILGKTLKEEFPEIEEAIVATRLLNDRGNAIAKGIISADNHSIKAMERYVTPNFLTAFSYPLIEGEAEHVLTNLHSVLLSKDLATKLFNTTTGLIGKTILWEKNDFSGPFTVSGIFENPPANSSAQFDVLFNYDGWLINNPHLQTWTNSGPSTYLLLNESTNPDQFNEKITNLLASKIQAQYGTESQRTTGTLFLQRFSDKYLHNRYENGVVTGGRIDYIILFSIVAFIILAIACINFMNLYTANAFSRLKEVGIKKTFGASRKILAIQYLAESMAMAFLALIVAVVLVMLLLPAFNEITGKQLSFVPSMKTAFAALIITAITGFFSGSYPALYVSAFNPTAILKGKIKTSSGENWSRKTLVIFQFTITIVLIVSVLVVYKQINFVQSKNLGYNKDNILTFKQAGKLSSSTTTFLNQVRTIPGVIGASSFGHTLTGDHGSTSGVNWPGKSPQERIEFGNLEVDFGLMDLLELEMLEGRKFSNEYSNETSKIIFNKAAISAMGIESPVGKTIKL